MKETSIKCDRCGKVFGLDEWPTVEFRGSSPTKVQMKAVIRESAGLSDTITLEDIDLCKECRVSFRTWFMGGKDT